MVAIARKQWSAQSVPEFFCARRCNQSNWFTYTIEGQRVGLSRCRLYDPDTGVFLSRDFLRFRNKYRAWSNNPVGQVDGDGLADAEEEKQEKVQVVDQIPPLILDPYGQVVREVPGTQTGITVPLYRPKTTALTGDYAFWGVTFTCRATKLEILKEGKRYVSYAKNTPEGNAAVGKSPRNVSKTVEEHEQKSVDRIERYWATAKQFAETINKHFIGVDTNAKSEWAIKWADDRLALLHKEMELEDVDWDLQDYQELANWAAVKAGLEKKKEGLEKDVNLFRNTILPYYESKLREAGYQKGVPALETPKEPAGRQPDLPSKVGPSWNPLPPLPREERKGTPFGRLQGWSGGG